MNISAPGPFTHRQENTGKSRHLWPWQQHYQIWEDAAFLWNQKDQTKHLEFQRFTRPVKLFLGGFFATVTFILSNFQFFV